MHLSSLYSPFHSFKRRQGEGPEVKKLASFARNNPASVKLLSPPPTKTALRAWRNLQAKICQKHCEKQWGGIHWNQMVVSAVILRIYSFSDTIKTNLEGVGTQKGAARMAVDPKVSKGKKNPHGLRAKTTMWN